MSRDLVHHPIQQAIDDIWKAGHTPRIQVDARRTDVVLPEQVKSRWGARLVLDLDAAWPLNLEYGPRGLEVDLAFQGFVTRCTLPWAAIYVVLDRATGRGMVVEEHVPKGDLSADEASDAVQAPRALPKRSTPTAVIAPPLAREPVTAEHAATAPESSDASEEEAKKRRARFKVIDGGR